MSAVTVTWCPDCMGSLRADRTPCARCCGNGLLADGAPILSNRKLAQVCKDLGMSCRWRADLREYRVNFLYGSEHTAYYTASRADALNTARSMATARNVTLREQAELAQAVRS